MLFEQISDLNAQVNDLRGKLWVLSDIYVIPY